MLPSMLPSMLPICNSSIALTTERKPEVSYLRMRSRRAEVMELTEEAEKMKNKRQRVCCIGMPSAK
eukprot:scaffold9642_cov97-Skeletonema_menzelii.AAC.2